MKQFITLTAFFVISNSCTCQVNSINEFNKERIKITKHSMILLGAWGGANLLYNGIAVGSATGSDIYFHRMNLIWGGVNFAIGTISFLFTKNRYGLSYSQSIKKQMTIEKIYLFNTGLDVAYMAGGLYFREKATTILLNMTVIKGMVKVLSCRVLHYFFLMASCILFIKSMEGSCINLLII